MRTSEKTTGVDQWNGWRRDSLWQMVERGTRVTLGFVVTIIVARYLGPGGFGLYSYALATVALLAFLGQAGLDSLLLRELIRAPERASAFLAEGLVLRLIGALCAGIASLAIAYFAASIDTKAATPLVAILVLSGIVQSGWIAEAWLHANKWFADVARVKIYAYIAGATLRVASLLLPSPLVAMAAATVIESFVAAVLLWQASRRKTGVGITDLSSPEHQHLLALARLSAPMLLSAFTIAIYSRIDVFMLGRMLGDEAAGLYSAGTMLSEGFYLIPTAIMTAVAPRLADLYMRDSREFESNVYRFLRLLSACGIGLAVITTLSATTLVPFIFGERYAPASVVVQIHIWSTWAVFLGSASDPWYINHDLRRFYLVKTSVAALLNIGLNFLLIPQFGIDGAAYATVVSYTASAVFVGAFLSNTRPLFVMQLRAIAGLPAPAPTRVPL